MPDIDDLHAALGLNLEQFLTAMGQPRSREGSAYTYCAKGSDDEPTVVDVLFDESGAAVDLRASTSGVSPAEPGHEHEHDHDHGSHVHADLPGDSGLALSALVLLGLTGLGAGTLTGRYRFS